MYIQAAVDGQAAETIYLRAAAGGERRPVT